MTEEKVVHPEQKPDETTPEQTLESLYEEYSIAQPGSAPVAAPSTEHQPAGNEPAAIQQEMAAFRQELAAERQRKEAEREQVDLNSAIATLGKEAGLEGKDLVLKGYLIAKATEDQRLRALWEKRTENPKAWDKALKIMAAEVKSEFQVPNPQLEENQRAMEESQRASSAVAPVPSKPEDQVMRMSDGEFSNFWGRLAGRG